VKAGGRPELEVDFTDALLLRFQEERFRACKTFDQARR
jgi:hypothetical protein